VTTPLSPAAQAVLDAFFASDDWEDEPPHANIAAALRAAADQVVPKEKVNDYVTGAPQAYALQRRATRREFLAIAAELEGHQ
jgi:hypothetical protein